MANIQPIGIPNIVELTHSRLLLRYSRVLASSWLRNLREHQHRRRGADMGKRAMVVISVVSAALMASALTLPASASQRPPGTCGPGNVYAINGTIWGCKQVSGKWTWVVVGKDPTYQTEQGGPRNTTSAPASKPPRGTRTRMGEPCQKFGETGWTKEGMGACRAAGPLLTWQPIDAWRTEGRFDPAPMEPEAPSTGKRMKGANKRACSNAWWDTEFAGVIPQLAGSGQSESLTRSIWQHCHEKYALYMTKDERDALYRKWFADLGQVVSDRIRQTSAETGLPTCDAAEVVLKPRKDPSFGLMGWDQSSFLPILYKQWQGGPIIGKLGDCQAGRLSLQFRRHYNGRHEGPYWPPLGTADATWPVSKDAERSSWVPAGVCLVWMPELGNGSPGSPAVISGFTYTNLGDGVDFFNADNEVIACSWRAKNAIGLPVSIAPQADLNQPITVTPDQAGIWYGMSNCAWSLTPADGSAPSEWNPGSKALTSIELRAGDRFATTCAMRAGSLYHFPVIPDGLFPLEGSLAPGLRKPATPATCRFAVVDRSALRQPNATPLVPWTGQPVEGSGLVFDGGSRTYLHSQGCGYWDL